MSDVSPFPLGDETAKAIESFGRGQLPREFICAYGEVKKACFKAQQWFSSMYPEPVFEVLLGVVDEVILGDWDDLFPLPVLQGGAGTSSHMNVNEVIASLTNDRIKDLDEADGFVVDPLDHLAKFQSTNDTFPTALTILVFRFLSDLESKVVLLQESLVKYEGLYGNLLMTGRTELQDALPITLGQVFGAWAGSIERDRWRLNKLKERLRHIALGGTAMGTCFSAPSRYVFKAEQLLREITGLPLCRSQNLPDEVAHKDGLAEVALGFQLLAGNLLKISNDLLLYSSSFLGEIDHGEFQYGSTIMPSKTNPVLLEFIKGLMIDVEFEAQKVFSYSHEGQLQLNAFCPFMVGNFVRLHECLSKALDCLSLKLLPSLKPLEDRMLSNLLSSQAMVNSLRQVMDYQKVKALVPLLKKESFSNLEELALFVSKHCDLSFEFLKEFFDPRKLTTYSEDGL